VYEVSCLPVEEKYSLTANSGVPPWSIGAQIAEV
jgi:hypothetical protein